ncbi:hypothetical protein [Lusitaniella coriacea]|uniref:hypothetical protein n=1 Tax=Lusitaniella coriacea TaxID=1983105 RepID=UPI003CF36857
MDAQKLDELAQRFKTSPGRILDIILELRSKGCPPEMLSQVLFNELLIRNFERVAKRLLIILGSCNLIISIVFLFLQLTLIPQNFRYDPVLKTVLGWGILGIFLSASIAIAGIVFCRKILENFTI